MNSGHCQCGAISYKIISALSDCCYCHCSICRRLTGSAAGVYGSVAKANFSWVSGKTLLSAYQQSDSVTRYFCSNCGSFLVSTHARASSTVYVSLGCLETDDRMKIEYQQFTASKASWSTLDPKLTPYEAWPDWIHERIERDQ